MKIKEKLQIGALLLMLAGALTAAEKKNIPYYDAEFPQTGNKEYLKKRCMLDLSTPDGVRNFPTLVWFHGGGITGGNKHYPVGVDRKKNRGCRRQLPSFRQRGGVSGLYL